MADKVTNSLTGSQGSDLLPRIYQSDANKKFIQATIDQLIQPGTVNKVNGYIGRKNAKASNGADVFVEAPDQTRQNYQLEPALVVEDTLGNVTYFKDYIDYINQLSVFGANTVNHARLNKEEFYSWDPHIDWDKFVNYSDYYWLPYGPDVITVYGQQNAISSTFVGVVAQNELGNYQYIFTPDGLTPNPTLKLYRGQTYHFEVNSPGNPFTIKTVRDAGVTDYYVPSSGLSGNAVEVGTITFTVPSDAPDILYYVSLNDADLGGILEIANIQDNTNLDVTNDLLGKKTYTLPDGTALSNGMKIQFAGNITPAQYATGKWYVEGVGSAIKLVSESTLEIISPYTVDQNILFDSVPFDSRPFSDASGYASLVDYILVNRASQDHNPWSRYNRWFHKDVITLSATLSGSTPELNQENRAKRPIIEFEADLKLFNFGNVAIADVDVIDTITKDVMSTIEGSIGYNVDGVDLAQGMRVLFTADNDRFVKNLVYTVNFLTVGAQRQIHLVLSDTPIANNTILVKSGKKNQSKMYWFDGTVWNLAQQKTKTNQAPLFDLVDSNKISFADADTYLGSTFTGTQIFSYKISASGTADPYLGFPLSYKNIDNIGDIVFNFNVNNESFTYKNNDKIITVQTDTGYFVKTTYIQTLTYVNSWQICDVPVAQAAVRIYKNSNKTNNFDIDIFDNVNALSDLSVKVYVNGTHTSAYTLVTGTTFIQIVFTNPVATTDVVTIKAYSSQPINSNGYYEIPNSLQNNPFNNVIGDFTLGEVIDHVSSIVDNTSAFMGQYPGDGNLRDLGNITQYGTKFIQHGGPLSLGLYHITTESNNVVKALEKIREDYIDFKRNFIVQATNLGLDADPITQVNTVLQRINENKSKTGPYYFSDMAPYGSCIKNTLTVIDYRTQSYPLTTAFNVDVLSTKAVLIYLNKQQLLYGQDYTFDGLGFVIITAALKNDDTITIYEYENTNGNFIPQTPTKLGLWPKYEPKIYLDTNLVTPQMMIQGHDGSQILAYGDYRDAMILELEKRIYNNIKVQYDPKIFDIYDIIPSYNRANDYSLDEFNQVLSPSFYKWMTYIDRDFSKPLSYDRGNPLTYNYKGHYAPNGQSVPGYWRGIYRWIYDTDRPNLAPWEMLGFTSQPTWWTTNYGPAPYTSDNLIMWQDLAAGRVRIPGQAPYINTKFVRPYLLDHIPVDSQGLILDPYHAGVAQGPITNATDGDYVFGDISPIESAWRRSSHFPYSMILTSLMLRPTQTFGTLLDRSRIVRNLAGQLINKDTGLRLRPQDIVLPSTYTSATTTLTAGLINWIVDYVQSDMLLSYKSYQYDLTNMAAKLSYRVGAFTSKEKFNLLLDSKTPLSTGNIFVPQENYTIALNSSSPVKKLTYSGLIITKLSDGFEIKGYSKTQPYFKYYAYQGIGNSINVGGISESYSTWNTGQSYTAGKVVYYNGTYYRVITQHTAGETFQRQYYSTLGSLPVAGGATAIFRNQWDRSTELVLPYSTKFSTIQQIIDFILGYGEYLKDQGFVFDHFNSNLQAVTNWETSAKEFLFWTTQNWSTGEDKWQEWLPNQPIGYNTIVRYNGDYYQALQQIAPSASFDSHKYIKLDGLNTVGSSVISLSPAADQISFNTVLSVVDDIRNQFNSYEIFKVDGTPLQPNFINLYRKDNAVTYKTTTGDAIYGASFYLVQKEQVLILDNSTIFNDTIYNPETGYRQERIKVSGYVSSNWYGGFDIPGFIFDQAKIKEWQQWQDYALGDIVKYKQFYYSADMFIPGTQDFDHTQWVKLDSKPSPKLLPNWTYKATQFTDFYSLDSDNFDASQQKVAQHLIGYQKRQYLDNIIQDDVSEFKFFQGMIREKGTQNSFNKLFDVLSADNKESINFYEEWAVRVGEYGASKAYENIEFVLDEAEFKNNPQGVELVDSLTPPYYDLIVRQTPNDIYLKPIGYNSSPWPLVSNYRSYLRSAGYVRASDTRLILAKLSDIVNQDITPFASGDHVWVGFEGPSWNIYRFTNTKFKVLDVTYTTGSLVIKTDVDHTLSVGSYLGIKEVTGFAGFYQITAVAKNLITLAATLTTPPASPFIEQKHIVVFELFSVRFANLNATNQGILSFGVQPGEKVWIDDDGFGQWVVYQNNPVFKNTEIVYPYPAAGLGLGRATALSNDDSLLVASTYNGQILVWDKASDTTGWIQRQIISTPTISKNDAFGNNLNATNLIGEVLALSPDKKWLAVGSPGAGYACTHYVGQWNRLATYNVKDIVQYNQGFYQAISNVGVNYPPIVIATASSTVDFPVLSNIVQFSSATYYSVAYYPTATFTSVATITVAGSTGLYVGLNLSGTGIPANTIINTITKNVDGTATLVLNHSVTAITTSTLLTFGADIPTAYNQNTSVFTTAIRVTNYSNIIAGMLVVGQGIATGTVVLSNNNGIIILSNLTTSLPTGSMTFGSNAIGISNNNNVVTGMYILGQGITPGTTITGLGQIGSTSVAFLSSTLNLAQLPPNSAGNIAISFPGTVATVATTVNGTTASFNITVASATGIKIGQSVVGTGMPANAVVSGINGTTVTLNVKPTIALTNAFLIFGTNQLTVTNIYGSLAVGQLVSATGTVSLPVNSVITNVTSGNIFLSNNLTQGFTSELISGTGASSYWQQITYLPVDVTGANSASAAQGAVSIYSKDSNNIFTLVDTIISPNPAANERFGSSLVFGKTINSSGNTVYNLYVGAEGSNSGTGVVYPLRYSNIVETASVYNPNGSSNSSIIQLSISNAGSGYVTSPSVSISTPSTTGSIPATAQAYIGVSAIQVIATGAGYRLNDLITVVGGTFTSPAILRVSAINGSGGITAVVIYSEGTYTAAPVGTLISVSGGAGSAAGFTFAFSVVSIVMTNSGAGYDKTRLPFVSLKGGVTAGVGGDALATAYAVIGSVIAVSDTTGINVGMTVSGTGFNSGQYVLQVIQNPNYPSITSGSVVLSASPDATPSGEIYFTLPLWSYANFISLFPAAGPTYYKFGHSMSISADGTILAVGAPGLQTSSSSTPGAVFMIVYNPNTGLYPTASQSYIAGTEYGFGSSVAVSTYGTYLSVGSPIIGSGYVNVYQFTTAWNLYQTLANLNPKPQEDFGFKLAFTNQTDSLIVYSQNADSPSATTFAGTTFDGNSTRFIHYEISSGNIDVYDNYINTLFFWSETLKNPSVSNSAYGSGFAVGTNLIVAGAPTAISQSLVSGRIFANSKVPGQFSWQPAYNELDKVDLNKIKRAFIYNKVTNNVLTYLDVIDPLQGRIPGPADQEIKYKSFYDPATYTNSANGAAVNVDTGAAWGPKQVGQLWWDLRTAKFIDSHDRDISYRTSNWSTLFPGASIDIYEWVETNLTPTQWSAQADTEAGLALNVSGQLLYDTSVYSLVSRYDTVSNITVNTYYFWVKNKTITPHVAGRSISAQSVSNLISNPRGQGYQFLALTGPNSFNLFNIKTLLKDQDAVLSVEYWNIDNPDQKNIHRQYAIISQDPTTVLPSHIEQKWFDSLCGRDMNDRELPDLSLPPKLRYGIENRPRQSMFINRYEALKQVIEQTNRVMLVNPIAEQKDLTALEKYETEPNVILGTYDSVKDTDAELIYINPANFTVPKLTAQLTDGVITGVNVLVAGSGYVHAPYITVSGSGSGAVLQAVLNTAGSVVDVNIISGGQNYDTASNTLLSLRSYSVLVHSDSQANGSWSVYAYDTNTQVWSRTRTQNYDVRKYWTYADWYATGYNQNTSPTFAVNTFTDLVKINAVIGNVVKIKTTNKGGWVLLVKYANSDSVDYTQSYNVVGIQNGTIQFSSSLYEFISTVYGYDGALYDGSSFDLVANNELRIILNTIKNSILTDDLKQNYLDLFFYSVRYAYSEQTELDWIFKTSFVKAEHNVGGLTQPATYQPDNLSNFEDYINEVKPYRTKVREYVSNYNKVETGAIMTTDFDLPSVYQNGFYENINTGIVNGKVTYDNSIINTYPWKNWLDNIGFQVTELHIVDGGSGYVDNPTVEFVSASGSGAVAKAYITNGSINRIILLKSGSGYLGAPTININGGTATGGRPAQVVAYIGNTVINTKKVGIKFDRISQNYYVTQLQQTESLVGTGSKVQFSLNWAPNVQIGTSSVTINNVPTLRSNYTLTISKDTSRGYTRYYGSITFTTAPAKGAVISVTYLKDYSVLNASDRIQYLYNPQAGQPGKDLSQLMTGIDYGGVIVNGLGFESNSGWDSTPFFSDKWDSADPTFTDYITQVGANTHSLTLPYTPVAGTVLNVYYSQLFNESYTSDGSTLVYTFNPRDNSPQITVATTKSFAANQNISGSIYQSNTAGSNVMSLTSVTGIYQGDIVSITPYVGNTLGLNVTVTKVDTVNNRVTLSQILYLNIANGSSAVFTRQLIAITTTNPFGKGVITLNTPLISGAVLTISSYLKPVRIDDPNYGTLQQTNTNAVMSSITADGVTNTVAIPVSFTVNAGDEFIVRQSTSDGSIKPQDYDYDTALTGGDLAYSTATGLAADDILVDGDQFITPTNSPAPEEVVPGQVVDAVAIKVFDQPRSGSANVRVDSYVSDGLTTTYKLSQTPNSPGAVIVKVATGTSSRILTVTDDYSIDYRNNNIVFVIPPALGSVISLFTLGFSGSYILDLDHFVGDGVTYEFVSKAKFIQPFTALVYVDGVAINATFFKTDTTYVSNQRIGIRFASPPVAGALINYIIVAGNQQTFAITKKERIIGNGSSIYNLQNFVGNSLPTESNMIVRVDNQILQPPSQVIFTVGSNRLNYIIDPTKIKPNSVAVSDVSVITANGTVLSQGIDYNVDPTGVTVKINKATYTKYTGTKLKVSISTNAGYTYVADTVPKIIFKQALDSGHVIEVMSSYNHDILGIQTTTASVATSYTFTPDTAQYYQYKAIAGGRIMLDNPVNDTNYVWVEQNGKLLVPSIDYILNNDYQSIQLATPPTPSDTFVIMTFNNNVITTGIAYMQFKDMLNRVVFKRLNKNKQTSLLVDLRSTDLTITVADASQFDQPNPALNRPGIIEIRGERIEFFTITGNVLGQLRRGTLGTGVAAIHRAGTIVQEIGASETIPYQDTITTSQIVSDGTNTVPLSFAPAKASTAWNLINGFVSSIPAGYGQNNNLDVFVGGYNVSEWTPNTVYTVGALVNHGSYQYKCVTANTSSSDFNTDIAYWTYFVGHQRLQKAPYKVYNVGLAPTSPEGDVQFDADFSVDGLSNALRLTNTLAVGTRITVVQRQGQAFDSTINLLNDSGPVATFIKAVPGSWYTPMNQPVNVSGLTLDAVANTFDNNAGTFDQG